ncbi:MAG: hypothetical protein K5754_13500 [Butyrivibrio sp.]|nr:hypothetical protein [Butyrivibrio sp.]
MNNGSDTAKALNNAPDTNKAVDDVPDVVNTSDYAKEPVKEVANTSDISKVTANYADADDDVEISIEKSKAIGDQDCIVKKADPTPETYIHAEKNVSGDSDGLASLYRSPEYKGGSESVYIPRDSEGNPIPLKKQRINGQDIPLPDPVAEGRSHTVWVGRLVQKQVKYIGNRLLFLVALGQVQMDMMFRGAKCIGGIMADHLLLDRMEDLLVILILMNIFSIMILIIIIGIERIQAHFIDDRGDDKYGLLY